MLNKMTSIAMMLGGAIAFTGSSFLFSSLSKDSIDKERKRHGLAIEKLKKAQIEWQQKRQQRIDFINKQLMLEKKAEAKFTELNDAMREYYSVFGKHLEPLPRVPVLSDFYTPSDGQHERELAIIEYAINRCGFELCYIKQLYYALS